MGLKVELAQIRPKLGDVKYNLEKHQEIISSSSADCIIFPELSLTGYILRDLVYEVYNESEKAIEKLSEENKCIVAGLVKEIRPGILRNTAAIIINHQINYIYKFYLPTYGLFEERRYFQPGDPKRDLKIFEYKGVKFGVIICEDAWHYEPIEALALLGADSIFIPAASPMRRLSTRLGIQDNWEALLKAHSIINGIWTIFVNNVGSQEEEFFWGGSMVVSPNGEVINRAKLFEEDIIITEINLDEVRKNRFFSSFREHNRDFHDVLRSL
ncbi:nitrilase-related carbon-nitrogen hydrolase [Sulfurisphaera ohwakuensis]|uniref:Amidohydrolase n=1 Tax=Sulfurisphaera ohwakuensis TaxID=69656 RepID=A0A650CJ24_SULOH|nr:nitrilase-related carbon-nitrogen hydrolase [Sulfurisphaera ohwakuensis]MBB5253476.1 putative amidohydrolase [Sulfurisphaera ohwakuensis]QGR17783.1 amidohydrolase [Sulfurisphaera ohwakuensis]